MSCVFSSVLFYPRDLGLLMNKQKFPVSYMWCVLRGYAKIDCQIDMNHMKICVAFSKCHMPRIYIYISLRCRWILSSQDNVHSQNSQF